ncbi:MAG: M20/M25/M40 family metallo-hydrolase [Candidatus Moduliflexus flocculans]|nr:M20/M25/M40 family metallo-hydrolase [Candidatus Moduliflexus flocculans]
MAASLGLPGKRDKVGNVLVSKPATAGPRRRRRAPSSRATSTWSARRTRTRSTTSAKDPIQAEIQGEWVYAQGTTLGADNGIGLAAALAVMEDKSLVHGPLEFLFTVDEETGLTGANKIQKGFLAGKMLLNLDSEDEGTFTIGCAGGADSTPGPAARTEEDRPRRTSTGCTSAASAAAIPASTSTRAGATPSSSWPGSSTRPRTTAKFEVVGVEGGSKHNAIPREAVAVWPARRSRSGR